MDRGHRTGSSPSYTWESASPGDSYSDTCKVTIFDVDITTPSSFPVYVCINDNLSLGSTVYPSGTSGAGTFSWTKASGPGTVTFTSSTSEDPTFSANQAGTYTAKVEFTINNSPGSCTQSPMTVSDTSGDIGVVDVQITSPTDANNKFKFDSVRPGVCTISVSGTTGISSLNSDLEWTLTSISGSTLVANPNTGSAGVGKGASVTFTYTTLPSSNSSFGQKTLTLSHPDIPSGCDQNTQTIEIYYTRDATNWPGADPNGGGYIPPGVSFPITPPYRFEKKNWYIYYGQTEADDECEYKWSGSECSPDDAPNYTPYVGALSSPHHDVLDINIGGFSVENSGDKLYGIDIYAWASRHEMRHHDDYNDWWGASGVIAANDLDGDRVPDVIEPGFPAFEGGPYDPTEQVTHEEFEGYGFDDQSICMFTQDDWTKDTHTDIDWAYPGSRWHP